MKMFPTLFAAIAFLVGLNLRPMLAIIGPLFPVLQQQTGLSATVFSLLTTLPVAMMGLAALSGPWLIARFGPVTATAAGLLCLMVACLWRGLNLTSAQLILTALAGGAGIGIIQAMMPALIRQRYADAAATLMALFSTGIMAGAALMAASAEPLFVLMGLQPALAISGVLALVTLLIWLITVRRSPQVSVASEAMTLPAPRTLLLTLFFGIGTGAYTLVLAWLPPFYIQLGWSARHSGYLLAALTLTEVVAGFIVTATLQRFPDRRPLLLGVLTLLLLGLLSLVFYPNTMPLLSALLLGTGIGALFPLSLIVTLDHARSAREAGTLLSRVQGGGYLIAALMPLVAGWVRDSGLSLTQAWLIMSAGVVLLMVVARRFRPQDSRA
ncbi:CynX/NimT family MFS transporter [Pantoea sp. VH_4]|uniref:CynX/NimT family MFS transporter n=2 Tax=Erwiniaceae TaxID=1903409 RepID=A0AB34CF37_9GAMM|nr:MULTISPECIES: MFS transporter [Pantoea]KAA5923461.1 CynX/NimT family MFS transporter [Pantoea sp. VH_8]KAA5929205.1 CynX/NimT family MFS transporter [Pantoea sp. VH_4]KAA5980164.1 CynX/NimT family MFS transporter [Pantoea sp. M_4]KAA6119640.1 CynX/NimT family MFS transporter [Pantoea gossypiicola]